ncbi:hypothetical protein [Thiomicrorhabdus sp.]|uniref:hypothetical protein n=1 Tax=Thiomicrorhabdus sp. TaxID=2039724 RepID=UPI0029C86F09|nr:hypothetical protein [Thiomicrorhabdus sp.]
MWFLFGFITLTAFIIYSGYSKFHSLWIGPEEVSNGKRYRYQIKESRFNFNSELKIGIPTPEKYNFSLKREEQIDRFFKKVGLSVEHQTGDKTFDQHIYIASDDSHLHEQLTHNKELSNFILEQFNDQSNYSVEEIIGNSGFLWIKLKVPNDFDGMDVVETARTYVPMLYDLSKKFSSPSSQSTTRDPFIIKAIIILAISSGLAINGFIQFFRISLDKIPFTLDRTDVIFDSIIIGGGMTFILAAAAIFFLKRSARAHLVLIEIFLVGFLGSVSTSFAGLRDVNMEFDTNPAQEYQVEVLDKWSESSRRSTSYYIQTRDWTGENYTRDILISSDFYNKLSHGSKLKVTQSSGYLNYRWVKDIEKSG